MTGCVNLTVDYPDINYYDLELPKDNNISILNSKGNIQIRDFTINRKYAGNTIFYSKDGIIKPYYYHKWMSDFNDLVTDYLFTTFSKSRTFEKGILQNSSLVIPDYILQGNITEYKVMNNVEDSEDDIENYIVLSMQVQLYKAGLLKENANELEEIFAKHYSVKIPRKNNNAVSIAPAFSEGIQSITINVLNDILEKITNENKL
jgi:ABC-type uncharacterized transport system auxiliary subunit